MNESDSITALRQTPSAIILNLGYDVVRSRLGVRPHSLLVRRYGERAVPLHPTADGAYLASQHVQGGLAYQRLALHAQQLRASTERGRGTHAQHTNATRVVIAPDPAGFPRRSESRPVSESSRPHALRREMLSACKRCQTARTADSPVQCTPAEAPSSRLEPHRGAGSISRCLHSLRLRSAGNAEEHSPPQLQRDRSL
jgi:hypothetical protein